MHLNVYTEILHQIFFNELEEAVNTLKKLSLSDKKAFLSYIDSCEKLIRPLNYPASQPGKGYVIYSVEGIKIAVLNAIGRVFMPLSQCPFEQVQKLYERLSDSVDIFILDFHAEATSEKVAMGYACDGKFACVFGTHTHVQTADNRLLPKKTAYISDIGMVGAYDSVIGMQKDDVINKFFDQLPRRFEPPESGSVLFCGIVVDVCVKTGLSNSIERFQEVI